MAFSPLPATPVIAAYSAGDNRMVVATDTIYPHEPRRDWDGALAARGIIQGRRTVSPVISSPKPIDGKFRSVAELE